MLIDSGAYLKYGGAHSIPLSKYRDDQVSAVNNQVTGTRMGKWITQHLL